MIIFLIIISIIIYFLFFRKRKIEHFNNSLLDNTDIYVLNMENDIDRLNNIKKYWNDVERINAYNGKLIDKDMLINNGLLDPDTNMKDGQIGCYLSHLKAWKTSLHSNKKYVLVLEDDVILENDTKNKINDLIDFIPHDWDILFLGGCNVYGKKINQKFLKPTKDYFTYNLCCHAMLINKKNINKLLNLMIPMTYPIDNQIRNHFDKLNIYYTYPNIINQNKDFISIRRVIDGLPQSKYWKENHLNMKIL